MSPSPGEADCLPQRHQYLSLKSWVEEAGLGRWPSSLGALRLVEAGGAGGAYYPTHIWPGI